MMGHCGVVSRQRRSVSSRGRSTTSADAEVAMQLAVHDEDAAPDDLARLADALERAAAEPEIHGRLAFADGALPAADEMRGRRRAGDEQHPDVVVHAVALIMLAPAQIVQRVFRRVSRARATSDR